MRINQKIGFSKTASNYMNKFSNLIRNFSGICQAAVVYLLIFQMFTQPIAVLAQTNGALQIPKAENIYQKNERPQSPVEDSDEGFLPNLEQKGRNAIKNAFGVKVPLPQVFGENGQLSNLFGGSSPVADKNQELIDLALNGGKPTNPAPEKSKTEYKPTEAAISINPPTLNGGLIDGNLRVAKSGSFTLGENFRLSENLYTVGSPNITTQQNSTFTSISDDKQTERADEYRVWLNGGKIDGNIHINSVAENIFADIPNALPQSSGTENIEINSAEDVKNIKDWSIVRNLTVNAKNLAVSVPAGNYENITLNAPTRLIFSTGNYNFTDTVNLHKESSIEFNGKSTVGFGGNLIAEDILMSLGKNTSADEVKLNVLGSAVIISGKSEISGMLRATNANVIIENPAKVSGQVIAGSLVMNGGTITAKSSNGRAMFAALSEDNIAIIKQGITLNGRIEGSVQQINGETSILNGSAVVTGDLLVPGVPTLIRNGSGTFGGTVVGTGTATPTGYQIILNGSTSLRKLKNRINPPTIPNIANPPASTGTVNAIVNNSTQYPTNFTTLRDLTVNGNAGIIPISPGTYRNFIVNGGSGLKLGTAGQTQPAVYNFNSLTTNGSSQIQIVGPVIINLTGDLILNGSIGVSNNPDWLKVRIGTGGVTLNGSTSFYGGVIAPNGTVTINGSTSLIGNVVCKKLIVNGNGLLRNVLGNLFSDTAIFVTSPANNFSTLDSAISVSGTAQSSVGVAGVSVNNQPATYNSATNTWTISNIALALGSNTITAKVIDNSGTEVVKQITVTRLQPVVDTVPPVIAISTPANNSATQSQTITVSGTASDTGANASGLANVSVNNQPATLNANGAWTISGIALNAGANTITAKVTDNAGNIANTTVTVTQTIPDTQPPTLVISSPANNFETYDSTVTISGTASDNGANPSGTATVTVNGQPATLSGNAWTISNAALTIGSNIILARAVDNAGNIATQQVTVVRKQDTTPPTIVVTSPANNFETLAATVTISGTATDTGTGATGLASVKINGQTATVTGGNWTINNVSLTVGSNTITAIAADVAGNTANATITIIRNEPDTTPPTVAITLPENNFTTTNETITVAGTVADSGTNASGVQSVIVNGINATLTGGTWTTVGVPLTIGTNILTATAKDNNNNISTTSVTIVRNPSDTTPPTILITSPTNNFDTFDSQVVVNGTAIDAGAGATGVNSVTVNGILATYNIGTNAWTATVNLADGINTITVVAVDNAPTPNQSQAIIQVTKIAVQPPTLMITNPTNGAFLSANSVTVAGNVSSNKPDMTFTVTVNGGTANLSGREFTKTLNPVDGTNIITVVATDALGQQTQQSITVTNDKTPPTVTLINVPQTVNPGETYTIGAIAADSFGVADVEFTVDGASITRSSVSPYQFNLSIPMNEIAGRIISISAIARDNAGLSATATARTLTTGPSGLTGFIFDDVTGYTVPNANAKLDGQNPVLSDENGLYSFISNISNGSILLSKAGFIPVERNYSATAGTGVEVFDARLTPLDSKPNSADVNGAVSAANMNGKIQIQFGANSFANGNDVRITSISPQGLANLLPFGWSPVPNAVVDIRLANQTGFVNRNFIVPATLSIAQVTTLNSSIPLVLVKYNAVSHTWIVVGKDIFAAPSGDLQTTISSSGQFAFLVADQGANAPPSVIVGQNLTASAAADSEQLDSATATAFAAPATALYSNSATSSISFLANSTNKLPSGISIEASFNDTYIPLANPSAVIVERPSQDFVLYSFPAATVAEPNKLGTFFVAKPVRADFTITNLLRATVHVDIRSGRLSQSGVLIGQTGGIVRGTEGAELEITSGAVNDSQVVFFNRIPNNQTGVSLPADYEIIGAFDINLANRTLSQSAKISIPATSGDNSRIVVAKVITANNQQGLKIVGRAIENNSRISSTISAPTIPTGINLNGIKDGGKYLFIRIPNNFGFVKGTVGVNNSTNQIVKVSSNKMPFIDVIPINGTYTILGSADNLSNQVDAISLNSDATGFDATAISAQNQVVILPITLANAALAVSAVTPPNGSTNIIVTTPITVTFNKPISGSTVTGSNFSLATASGNPVITTITILAGGRSVVLTPAANLIAETNYKVRVNTNAGDIYGNSLPNTFESTFRTANLVSASNQLQPSQIIISYPNDTGYSTISIPADSVPSGSTIFAVNNSTGATVSTVAGTNAVELFLQARVGDEIELIIRQPDGVEYRIKQAAYRRADGFVSVGSNGGTITSSDGTLVLQVPAGAISGQADVKMSFAPESSIAIPREGEMAPSEMAYIGGVKVEVQGNFTENEELHLELPAPPNTPEDKRAVVMKPTKINVNGSEIDSWETITSAKIEGGKIKTTSPPFFGVTLIGLSIGLLNISFYIFVPQRQKVVTGLVRRQKSDGTYSPVIGAICSIKTLNGEVTQAHGVSQSSGKFTIIHNNTYYPAGQDVPVQCSYGPDTQEGLAFPYSGFEAGLSGFESRFVQIIYPASLITRPEILIETSVVNQGVEDPIKTNILKTQGKFIMGTAQEPAALKLTYKLTPASANPVTSSPQLVLNGNSAVLSQFDCNTVGQTKFCAKIVPIEQVGRYGVIIKARNVLTDPTTESRAIYNFVALESLTIKPPIADANPFILTGWTPSDGAAQIDVAQSVHIEFSEPVKNLVGGNTIYLSEESTTVKIGGTVRSGGVVIGANQFISDFDFVPSERLKGGKTYKIVVKSDVTDTENLGVDQDKLEPGLQEFNSLFTTFQGTVITPAPIAAKGYKIAVLDDFAVTTNATLNGQASAGTLQIYDLSTFIDSSATPQSRLPINSLRLLQVPVGLAVESVPYQDAAGKIKYKKLIAVTTISTNPDLPRNVWFYRIDENRKICLTGVVSLVGNGNSGQVPNSIDIEGDRAYIGSSGNGGVYVVDMNQAFEEFRQADNTPNDGDEYNNNAALKATSPSYQVNGGGFGQEAIIQRATYKGGNDTFPVIGVSAISQNTSQFAYVASYKNKLVSFNFAKTFDGRIGYAAGGTDGKDIRVTADKDPIPAAGFVDIKTAKGLQIQGETKDIAVAVSTHLLIFDITAASAPKQYPTSLNPNDPQLPAKSFSELGVPIAFGPFAKQVEIEGTLVYALFDNGVAVFDIRNPNDPYLTTLINNLNGLRRFAVKDGFIYTLGTDGINVSIGRAVAQVVTYGYDPTNADDVCGNPVVVRKDNNKLAQPAGIFFQLYGHSKPTKAKVIIRKVENDNGVITETEIATVAVRPEKLKTISNPTTGTFIVTGSTFWEDNAMTIDRTATYTAEVVVDNDFHSPQVEIPFSNLLPDNAYTKEIQIKDTATSQDPNASFLDTEQVGNFAYLLTGNAVAVEFKINNTVYPLYDSYFRNQSSPNQPPVRKIKDTARPFGSTNDFLIPNSLNKGLYPFTYKATLKASPVNNPYSEEISGTIRVGQVDDDLRKPGSTVVNGVEINSGNLAVSENDVSVKGRGLSLEFTRSYNSQNADSLGTLGYGWNHNYQILLIHSAGKYRLSGGEGSGQTFLESNLKPDRTIKAEKPYLGSLVKNIDGTFDYLTKSQTKYHFRRVVEQGNPDELLSDLEYIEEPNGNRISLFYDTDRLLKTVKDSSNQRSLNFEYEQADNIFAQVNPGDVIQGFEGCPKTSQFKQITGRLEQSVSKKVYRIKQVKGSTNLGQLEINYVYDSDGNLISATRIGNDAARNWKYDYNPTPNNSNLKYAHLLESVKSPNNPDEVVTKYEYFFADTAPPRVSIISMPKSAGNFITNTFSYTFDTNTNLINGATFTDGNNNTPTIYSLVNGRVETITAPNNAVTYLKWTDFGQIKETTDPELKKTIIEFDNNNNPTTQILSGGAESIQTITTFDAKFSKMTKFTDGRGNATDYAINSLNGNVDKITLPNLRTVDFRYAANGDLLEVTDQYGTKTVFSNYDSYGNPQTITKQLGGNQTQVISQTFDDRSRQLTKNDSLGTNVTIEYDGLDRPTKQITSDPAGYRDALTTETTYHPEGQPVSQKQTGIGQSNESVNTYDSLQRLTKTVETVSGYAPITRNFTYDNNSNLLTEQNRRSIITAKTYNALNHLNKIQQGAMVVWEANDIDKVGNPKTVKDLYGNITSYEYDGLQRLTKKLLPLSKIEELKYDKNNNITNSFDRNGNETEYSYDALNRVAEVKDALGRFTKWTYTDAEHKVVKEIAHRKLLETTVMDGLERPVSQQIKFGSSPNPVTNYETSYLYEGRTVSMTDGRGIVTKQKLSGFGEVGEMEIVGANPVYKTSMKYSALGGISKITDANNRVTMCVNDGFNRKTSVNINGGVNLDTFTESWKYDGEGLMTEHTDKRGVLSEMKYDDLGRKTETFVNETLPATKRITAESIVYDDVMSKVMMTDANLHSTVQIYDGLRRVSEIENAVHDKKKYKYDGENLLEETDFTGEASRFTKYEYDVLNRVIAVKNRNNERTGIVYEADDLTKTTTDRRGQTTIENYDALGRLVNASDLAGKIASFTYDANSNRLTQQDGESHETGFTYDKLNRVTDIVHPADGQSVVQTETMTYDAVGNVLTHFDGCGGIVENLEYNTLNQAKKAKDGVGNVTEFTYDGGGLMTSKTEPKGYSSSGYKTTYSYNAFGSLVGILDADGKTFSYGYDDTQNLKSVKDPLNRIVGYDYDNLNRMSKTTQPMGRITDYTYDKNSNVKTVIDPKRQVATMGYDNLDRLETATYKDNLSASEKLRFKYEYDAEDNLKFVTETKNLNVTRTYSREYDVRERLSKTTDAFGKIVRFEYDKANNLTKLTDTANRETRYEYDAKNQLDLVKQNNNVTVANYDWKADGLLDKVTYQNSTSRNYVYDSADRVSSITNSFGNDQSETFGYGYDANSNRITETKQATNQTTKNIRYQYDSLDRLSQVKTTTPTTSQIDYTYDAVGNRRTEIGVDQYGNNVNRTASYDDLNQLKTLANGNVTESFNYDDNGNLVETKLNNSSVTKFEYDIRNQLSKYTGVGNGINVTFDYDFERKRTSKTSASSTTNYTYAGNQVVNETNNNVISASYTIGGGEVVKSEFVANGESNYHFTDALGSVTSLTNNDGSLTSRSDYDAFGLQTGGSSANSIGYTGQRLDNETGLMALGNGERYYSPSYARFIQQDSVSGKSMSPQTMNRFSYVTNNPNKFTDSTGHEGEKDETAEWLRETRKAVSNHSSGSWWADFHSNVSLSIMEVGYGGYKFGKDFVTQPIYGEIDKVKDAYYNAVGADYNDRSYLSSTYQSEQSKIVGGMSVNQAKWETTKAQVYSAATFGLGPLVESTGSNIYALIDGRMDLTDYNIGQGKNLTEAVAMYAMAKGSRLAMESSGAAKPMTFRESLGNLKSDAISLRNTGSRAISSIKETVGKVYVKASEKLGGDLSMSSKGLRFGDDAITVYNKNNLVPKEGWTDVVVHGKPDGKTFGIGKRQITPNELAEKMINEGYKPGTPVRLFSCHAGRTCTGGAAQLSEILKTKVEAPTVPVQAMKDGSIWLDPSYRLKPNNPATRVKPTWNTFENGKQINE
jgi:RHS repeat-associated protein